MQMLSEMGLSSTLAKLEKAFQKDQSKADMLKQELEFSFHDGNLTEYDTDQTKMDTQDSKNQTSNTTPNQSAEQSSWPQTTTGLKLRSTNTFMNIIHEQVIDEMTNDGRSSVAISDVPQFGANRQTVQSYHETPPT